VHPSPDHRGSELTLSVASSPARPEHTHGPRPDITSALGRLWAPSAPDRLGARDSAALLGLVHGTRAQVAPFASALRRVVDGEVPPENGQDGEHEGHPEREPGQVVDHAADHRATIVDRPSLAVAADRERAKYRAFRWCETGRWAAWCWSESVIRATYTEPLGHELGAWLTRTAAAGVIPESELRLLDGNR